MKQRIDADRIPAVFAITVTGAFMVALDLSIVNIAFPSIQRSFAEVSTTTLSWVLSSYLGVALTFPVLSAAAASGLPVEKFGVGGAINQDVAPARRRAGRRIARRDHRHAKLGRCRIACVPQCLDPLRRRQPHVRCARSRPCASETTVAPAQVTHSPWTRSRRCQCAVKPPSTAIALTGDERRRVGAPAIGPRLTIPAFNPKNTTFTKEGTQMTAKTLEDAIAQNHAALDSMLKGDSTGYVALLSDRDDVTWGNPFGPFARGRESVEAALASAATRFRGGGASEFDHIATYMAENLAVVVQVEHGETKLEGADALSPAALRVTSVYRLEGDAWRLVHRHADPITTPR